MTDIKFTYKGPKPLIGLPDHDISQVDYDRLSLKLQAVLDAGVDEYEAVKPQKQSKSDTSGDGGDKK